MEDSKMINDNTGNTTAFDLCGGFDESFVDSDDDRRDLLCPICYLVSRRPTVTHCCAQLFCQSCLSRVLSDKPVCPYCKQPCAHPQNTSFDLRANRQINSLRVKCRNAAKGCAWTGSLCDLRSHLVSSCDSVMCPHGCETVCSRDSLSAHITNECPNAPLPCEFAAYGCDQLVPRSDVDQHKSDFAHLHAGLMEIHVAKQKFQLNFQHKQINNLNSIIKKQMFEIECHQGTVQELRNEVQREQQYIHVLQDELHKQRRRQSVMEDLIKQVIIKPMLVDKMRTHLGQDSTSSPADEPQQPRAGQRASSSILSVMMNHFEAKLTDDQSPQCEKLDLAPAVADSTFVPTEEEFDDHHHQQQLALLKRARQQSVQFAPGSVQQQLTAPSADCLQQRDAAACHQNKRQRVRSPVSPLQRQPFFFDDDRLFDKFDQEPHLVDTVFNQLMHATLADAERAAKADPEL